MLVSFRTIIKYLKRSFILYNIYVQIVSVFEIEPENLEERYWEKGLEIWTLLNNEIHLNETDCHVKYEYLLIRDFF